jgi:hypothetical protein
MVEAVDLGTPRGSVELVEFCPVNMVVLASLYPNYQSWMGQANFAAPITCPMGGPGGMSTIYRANYTGPTFQPIDPMNTNPGMPTEGGVLVTPTFNWNMTNGLTSYFPFPVFTPPFDYLSTGQATGLIWEVNIEPGNQVSNFVKYRSTNFTPVRRLIGVPISLGSLTSTAGGCETYATRYTFVNIVSQTRSEFYDTGVPMNPRYGGVSITPRPSNQPSGTSSIWEFEGATGITGPTTPSGVTTGFLTYYSGAPAGDPVPGIEDNLIFFDPNSPTAPQLTGNRYFRFRATLRSDNLTNRRQSYNSVVMSVNVGM